MWHCQVYFSLINEKKIYFCIFITKLKKNLLAVTMLSKLYFFIIYLFTLYNKKNINNLNFFHVLLIFLDIYFFAFG